MGFSEAVLWWEEWQLRILVLTSLFLQYFLFVTAALRKHRIPAWFRFLIWLAYLGSDAVAIYALAALYNRHKKLEPASIYQKSTSLQVLWAPILLLHLGGQNGITAYNIEDNELWMRHIVTAVSQVTITIYVFSKSWPKNNANLVMQAILFFLAGVLKCFLKPWDLMRVSINSLVDSSSGSEDGDICSLHEYIQAAVQHFQVVHGGQLSDSYESNPVEIERLYGLFVDVAPTYSVRIVFLKKLVQNPEIAHLFLQHGLSDMFNRLYTKESLMDFYFEETGGASLYRNLFKKTKVHNYISTIRVSSSGYLVGGIAVALYYMIQRDKSQYNQTDVNITYVVLFLTLVLELFIPLIMSFDITKCRRSKEINDQPAIKGLWSDQVAQYNLLGYLARNKKHRKIRKLATLLGCKNYVDQIWCMKPSNLSRDITQLICRYIRTGWLQINDTKTYRRFNDNRGQWTLHHKGLLNSLGWSMRRPFDESIVLWHLATDFTFHYRDTPAAHEAARRSRVMSNYMVYLLFVNPEMLLAGARRNLFRSTYEKLNDMTLDENQSLGEKQITQNIIQGIMATSEGHSLVHDAWKIAQVLISSASQWGDDDKMWRVIQGVWIEMLCFSAGRCRGYLHAKSLGKGGEYLSYVWLLLSFMGMETLAEKMQRTKLHEEEDNGGGGTDIGLRASSLPTFPGDNNV